MAPSEHALLVYHDHVLVGRHDARCVELPYRPDDRTYQAHYATHPFHRRHEGNTLVVHEDGQETARYQPDQWSAAAVDLPCGYTLATGPGDCPRCAVREDST